MLATVAILMALGICEPLVFLCFFAFGNLDYIWESRLKIGISIRFNEVTLHLGIWITFREVTLYLGIWITFGNLDYIWASGLHLGTWHYICGI